MANTYNKYQLKRTSVSGRTPNTTSTSNSSFLDTAELALNLTDKKMFSSNGTSLFEIGANLSSLSVAGNVSITDTFFGNNVTLSGNLTVSGTTTYINTVIFTVGDNIVTLNADLANNVAPSENSGFEVNRGSSANVQFIWDESNDRWTTNNQPMFVGGTFASGNTTVTGFANVSSFLNVVGAATVNGALVVNNTAATGNLTVTGLANVNSLNITGAATVNGAVTINNTAAFGNTTITGFVNVSSYGTFGGTVNAAAVNVGANVNLTTASITVGNSTVNAVHNQTNIVIGNTTVNTTVSATAITSNATLAIGNTTVTGFLTTTGTANVAALNVGANVNLTTSSITVGNSTVNAVHNQTSVVIGNTTVNTSISATAITSNATLAIGNTTVTGFINASSYGTFGGTVNATALNIGSNVNLTTSSITVGNSTVNAVHNQINIVVGNTTVNTSISATAITSNATLAIGNTTVTGFITSTGTVNAAALNIGSNVNLTTSSITVGNSTVNAVHNQTNIIVGNTTVNTSISATAVTSSATLAIGNTTITGFANVSSILNVVGAATVNGALTVNNTAATGNLTVTGLTSTTTANVTSSLNVVGATTVNGALTVNNTAAVGNTTVTGFITLTGTANVAALNVGANVNLNTTQLNIGNTTVNAVLNSTSLVIANSANVTTNGHEFVLPAATGKFKISRDIFSGSQNITFETSASGEFIAFNSTNSNSKSAFLDVTAGGNTGADTSFNVRIEGTTKLKANSTIVTVSGAANVTGPFAVSNTTSLSGNTTITGFANVSTTLNVVGAATVNGALTVNNTAATGNLTVTGLTSTTTANVTSSLNVVGAATVNGALTVNNTAALGNTTITGFANVSSTLNVVGAATVNGALTVNNTAALGNTTITGFANASSLNVVGAATVNGAFVVNNTASVGNTTITGSANVSSTLNVVGAATVNGAFAVNNTAAFGNTTITGTLGTGNTTITGNLTVTGNTTANNIRAQGSVQIDGNLTVSGNTISIGVTNLSISDNLISLNEPETATITTVTSNATSFIYTANNGFYVGQIVTVTGMTPAGYNVTSNSITFANATTFAVANTVAGPGAYVSGGTAAARVDTNPDIGFTGNYNDGTYRHAGFFRDATDGVFKVFDQYLPEPTGAFIDTSNTSFRIADFQANNTTLSGNTYLGGVSGSEGLRVAVQAGANRPLVIQGGVSGSLGARLGANENIDYYTTGSFGHHFATNGPRSAVQLEIAHTASSVNWLKVTGAPTGSTPYFLSSGSDTDIGVTHATKGAGAFAVWTNGGTTQQFRVAHTASAVNYVQVSGAATSGAPYVLANGSDTDIPLVLSSKGAASILFKTAGTTPTQFAVAHTASAVNYVQASGSATGAGVLISSQGSDTNVNINYWAKGNSAHIFATGSSYTQQLQVLHTASAVNYVQVTGAATGSAVSYTATGTDTNVFSQYRTKGTGAHDFYTNNNIQFRVADSGATNANYIQVTGAATSGIPIIQATGSDTNVNFGISSKNAASVYFYTNNGAAQFEVSPTASAVNRLYVTGGATGVAPKIVATGSDANVSIAYTTKGTGAHTFTSGGGTILALTDTASAVNYAQIYPAATGAGPSITWTGADATVVGTYNTKGAGAHLFYTNSNPQFRIADAASSVNYIQATGSATGNRPSLTASGTDTNIDMALYSKGTGGIAHIANNALQMYVSATASAVNYVQITGAATGNHPTISSQGSDANARLILNAKGSSSGIDLLMNNSRQVFIGTNGSAVNYLQMGGTATGVAPTISVQGSDTNIDLGFTSKGTGGHIFNTGGGQQVRINDGTTGGGYTLFSRDNTNNAQMLTAANTANMYIQATGGGVIHFKTAIGSETQVVIDRTASAVNYLRFTGSATGSAVSVSAAGADANVGMSFAGKGTGTLNLNSNTTFNANTLLFTGSNTAITLRVADNGILSFEGGAGQLFSIANNLTGQIFAVNDISGIPSLEVYSNGQVNIARYNGNVSIGTSTSTLTVNGAVSFGNAVTFSNTIAVTGAVTFSNTIIANGALTLSSTGAALTLSNTSSAFINFGAGGYAAPSVGTRSTGAKIVLFNQLSATAADYAIGVEGAHMWFGTDVLTSGYKWYANTTNIMTSNTTGLNIQSGGLSISGTSAIDSNRNGSFANVTIAGNLTVSGTTTYINTTTLNIGDNIITLNADLPGGSAPTENAGIEINRGSSANVSFIWDETNDVWASQINGVSKLTVSNTTTFVTGNTSLLLGVTSGGTEGGEIGFAGVGSDPIRVIDIDAGNNWRFNSYSSNGNITFNTNATPVSRLLIAANGNIGIGNTTPIDTLSVTGTAQVTNSTASVFLAAANGNIGLGTTVPAYPIHVIRNANTAVAEIRVENANTGSGAQSRFNMVTASAFSYALHALSDGPTPSYSIGTGPGVTGGVLISAANAALTLAANNVVSLKIFANNNIAIGANSTPTEKLRVEGTLSHTGLVPSTGTGIDQIFTATPSITLNTTWQSTGVTSTNLANGTYVVQLLANDIAAGGTANNEYYSGMMSWYSADTNSTVLDEIPLHRAGVSGSNNAIFLATQRTATANTSDLLLMISSAANNSGASTYTIKLRRMI